MDILSILENIISDLIVFGIIGLIVTYRISIRIQKKK